jgi:hypothetical protein
VSIIIGKSHCPKMHRTFIANDLPLDHGFLDAARGAMGEPPASIFSLAYLCKAERDTAAIRPLI